MYMKKLDYKKPTIKVYPLTLKEAILAGSNEPSGTETDNPDPGTYPGGGA